MLPQCQLTDSGSDCRAFAEPLCQRCHSCLDTIASAYESESCISALSAPLVAVTRGQNQRAAVIKSQFNTLIGASFHRSCWLAAPGGACVHIRAAGTECFPVPVYPSAHIVWCSSRPFVFMARSFFLPLLLPPDILLTWTRKHSNGVYNSKMVSVIE